MTAAQPLWAAPGDLDPAFGTGGKVASDVSAGPEDLDDATLDPDGRVVAVGQDFGLFAATVVRYKPDGTLDLSFSGDGLATLDDPFGSEVDSPGGVSIQSTGRIVVGLTTGCPGQSFGLCWVVAGYEVDGDLDPTFGSNGLVALDFQGDEEWLLDLTLGPNDEIVLSGSARRGRRFAVARLSPDGEPDPSFGGDGKATARFARPWAQATSVAIDSAGRVIAAGAVCHDYLSARCLFAASRFRADGVLDTAFSGNGKVVFRFPNRARGYANAVAVRSDDTIVLAGEVARTLGRRSSFGIARLLVDGRLDSSFSRDGLIATDFFPERRDGALSVALQPDGKVVAAGFAGGFLVNGRFAVVRYWPRGSRDMSFGGDGKVTTRLDPAGDVSDRAEAVLVQSDGKLVVAGDATLGNFNYVFGLVRYLGS